MAKGRQRSQKFYLKNEAEVMIDLGLKPTKGSGAGWIEKEDGQNDHVICQLKSTDKMSMKLNQLDLEKLEHNALVSKKIPLFVIQFLNKDTRYALMAIEDIPRIAKYIECGEVSDTKEQIIFTETDETLDEEEIRRVAKHEMKIRSDAKAREKFNKEKQKQWEERKWKK